MTSDKHYKQKFGYVIGAIYTTLHTLALKRIEQVVSISKAVSEDLNTNNINSNFNK